MSIYKGIAGKRESSPKGIFLHNDAGGEYCTAEHYRNWLPLHKPELGFAHAYVCSDGVVIAEEDGNCAWHCGDSEGNREYYSIEICQSYGNETLFLQNEEKALQLAATKCLLYGIVPSKDTIRLHREVSATACPHRSVELHGGAAETKEYFIQRIREFMNPMSQTVNAVISDNTGSKNMRFMLKHETEGNYYISEMQWGLYLTADGIDAGTNVKFCGKLEKKTAEAEKESPKRQLWILRKQVYKNADYTMLESAASPGLFLSVENNGQEGKDNLKLWTDLHNMKQKFYIREETDGTSLLIHAFTGKCVSARIVL